MNGHEMNERGRGGGRENRRGLGKMRIGNEPILSRNTTNATKEEV
jgi:hypothetical protein